MATLIDKLSDFKYFKNNPPKTGGLHTTLTGLKQRLLILVPGSISISLRWKLLQLSLGLIWSLTAPPPVVTSAFLTLLTIFSEQPAQMLRSLANDPDIEAQILEVVLESDGSLKFSSRGASLSDQEKAYQEMAEVGPDGRSSPSPFIKESIFGSTITSMSALSEAILSITLQVWILLTKAVTAPDTARESEQRRWLKYLQQRRAKNDYKLKTKWLDIAREKMAGDISIRRFMVEILIEINKSTGTKNRVIEVISDIGNYIAETGMAGFFLTIKFGLETRYPTLALNEFQGDLTTILQLMELYKSQGDRAPYLVLLEDSVQTKFAPGNYPLLWSYAMGIGVTLDRSMNNLNFNRGYLEPNFFKLGQDTVIKLEGNVDQKMVKELDLNPEQIAMVKEMTKSDTIPREGTSLRSRTSHFAIDPVTEEDFDNTDDDAGLLQYRTNKGISGNQIRTAGSRLTTTEDDTRYTNEEGNENLIRFPAFNKPLWDDKNDVGKTSLSNASTDNTIRDQLDKRLRGLLSGMTGKKENAIPKEEDPSLGPKSYIEPRDKFSAELPFSDATDLEVMNNV
nr:nucleocapsid protein [Carollia bat paramyxovirus]